jgi:hypothetical protein
MGEFIKVMKELYSCRICQDTCLKDRVGFPFPEPFLGNPNAKFAIVGVNPSHIVYSDSPDYFRWIRFFENNIENYLNYYKQFRLSLKEYKEWQWVKGYVGAYNMLTNRSPMLDDSSKVDDFNENVIILNIIKCSTAGISGIPKRDLETAKNYCIGYLLRQLAIIQPRVILSHGRPASNAIIEILKSGTNYRVDEKTSSCNTNTLAGLSMDEISRKYIIAKKRKRSKNLVFIQLAFIMVGKG